MCDIAKKIVEDILEDLHGRAGIGNELDQIDDDIREEIKNELQEIVHQHIPVPRKHQKAIIIDEHVSAPIVHWALCQSLKEDEATLRLLQRASQETFLTYAEICMLPATLRDMSQEGMVEQIDSWVTLVEDTKHLIKEFEFFKTKP